MSTPIFTIRLRLDEYGTPTITGPKPLHLVSGQQFVINLTLEQLNTATVPPSYSVLDITGWTGNFRAKDVITDTTTKISVPFVLVTPASGIGTFTVTAAQNANFIDHGVAEFEFASDGTNMDLKVEFAINVAESVSYYTKKHRREPRCQILTFLSIPPWDLQ